MSSKILKTVVAVRSMDMKRNALALALAFGLLAIQAPAQAATFTAWGNGAGTTVTLTGASLVLDTTGFCGATKATSCNPANSSSAGVGALGTFPTVGANPFGSSSNPSVELWWLEQLSGTALTDGSGVLASVDYQKYETGDTEFQGGKTFTISGAGVFDFLILKYDGEWLFLDGLTATILVSGLPNALSHYATVCISCDGPPPPPQQFIPLPAAFPLFASGLGVLGLLGWRRRRKAAA